MQVVRVILEQTTGDGNALVAKIAIAEDRGRFGPLVLVEIDGVLRGMGKPQAARGGPGGDVVARHLPEGRYATLASSIRPGSANELMPGMMIGGRAAEVVLAGYEAARLEYDAAKAANLPGLEELRAARLRHQQYRDRFERMMEDEHDDGARMPALPGDDLEALRDRYPRAALYLRAESYEDASHHAKSAAGRRARHLLEAGAAAEEAARVLDGWLPESARWD